MATKNFINDDEIDIEFNPSSIEQIEELVNKPTWREMLLEIVDSNNLDPWNIDISVVTNSYIEKIRKMKIDDLHIPANVILAASILLRFKAQTFQFEETEPPIEEVYIEEGIESAPLEMIQLRMRMQPKRAITLPDLISALEDAIKIEVKREKERIVLPTVLEFKPPEYDIEKETKNVYEYISKYCDENGMILFSELLKLMNKKGPKETVLTLLPLLHLCQKNKITVDQEEFFGDIIIQKLDP
ncbi:MAG: segregation/condensation protein A, partial [Candidatus Micrarchaeia archaeon]